MKCWRLFLTQEAEKSLKFYKGYEGKSEIEKIALQKELEKLKSAIKASNLSDKVHWKDFGSQTAIRGMIIGVAMAWFLQLTGKRNLN